MNSGRCMVEIDIWDRIWLGDGSMKRGGKVYRSEWWYACVWLVAGFVPMSSQSKEEAAQLCAAVGSCRCYTHRTTAAWGEYWSE
jgi:hypothetical protein